MPFFLANPESIPSRRKKGGSTGLTGYIRTAPSSLFILVDSAVGTMFQTLIWTYLHLLAALIHRRGTDPSVLALIDSTTRKTVIVSQYSHSLALALPSVFMSVVRNSVSDEEMAIINDVGLEEFTYGNNRYVAYTLDHPNLLDVHRLLDVSSLSDEDSPRPHVAIQNMAAWVMLVTTVTTVGLSVFNAAILDDRDIAFKWPTSAETDLATHALEYEDGELPFYTGDQSTGTEVTQKMVILSGSSSSRLSLVLASMAPIVHKNWGSVADLKAINSRNHGGILIPYEMDFSNPDLTIIFQFVERFSNFFNPEDLKEIVPAWGEDLAGSNSGQWLAHIMVVITLAYKSRMAPFFIIRPNGIYDGAVLLGNGVLATPRTGRYESLSVTDLYVEIDNYNFHESALNRIVRRCGIVAPIEDITSMRKLRSLIIPGVLLPAGDVVRDVRALLKYLSFNERPLSGTISDYVKIFPLLADSSLDIPMDLFLHFEHFFSLGRMELVLSAFGNMVPNFSLGNTATKMSPVLSAQGTKATDRAYSPSAPILLQMKRGSMSSALMSWEGIMRHGTCSLKTDTKVKGGRSYGSTEKQKLWAMFASLCAKTVPAYQESKSAGSGQMVPGGQKRNDRDEDGGDTSAGRGKRSRIAKMFG